MAKLPAPPKPTKLPSTPKPTAPPSTPKPVADSKGGAADGQYTGADLAAVVALSPDISKLTGGTQIDDVELEKIIATRISGQKEPHWSVSKNDDWERARDLAEIIVDALPPDLHNAEVAGALDFRPYLEELNGKKIVFRSFVPLLPDIKKAKTVDTGKWLKKENERLAGDAIVAAGGTDTPPDTTFETGTAGVVPQVNQTSATGITVGPNGEIIMPTSATEEAAKFPIEGLRAAVQEGVMSLEQLAIEESNNLESGSTQYFPVDVGKPTTPMPGVPSQSTDTISAGDALRYLYSLKPAEVHSLQLKMAAAGYFDKLDNGGAYTDGDPTDRNTQAAWNMLLSDSITTKRSVPAVLGQGLRDYRTNIRDQRLKQLGEIDGSYSRAVANDFGQSVLGRNLQGNEIDELTNYLTNLRDKRAGYVAGDAGPGNSAGPLQGDAGFTQDDVQIHLGEQEGIVKDRKQRRQLEMAYLLQKAVPS